MRKGSLLFEPPEFFHNQFSLEGGLAHESAVAALKRQLTERLKRLELRKSPFRAVSKIRPFQSIAALLSVILLVVAIPVEIAGEIPAADGPIAYAIQAIVLSIAWVVFFGTSALALKRKWRGLLTFTKEIVKSFAKEGSVHARGHRVPVWRDAVWRLLPLSQTVKGDIVFLSSGIAPCHMRRYNGGADVDAGSRLTPIFEGNHVPSNHSCYLLLETPGKLVVERFMKRQSRQEERLDRSEHSHIITKLALQIFYASFIISLLVNLIRIFTNDSALYAGLIITRLAFVIIPLFPLLFPSLTDYYTQLRIRASVAAVMRNASSVQGRISRKNTKLPCSQKEITKIQNRLLLNTQPKEAFMWRHFSRLSEVTTFVVLDKEVIVRELSAVEEVFFFKEAPVILRVESIQNEGESVEEIRFEAKLEFSDADWMRHISSLKPIGLNCVLTRACHQCLADHTASVRSQMYRQTYQTHDDVYMHCLCPLANVIGFSSSAGNNFAQISEIHTFGKRKAGEYMRSNIVQEQQNGGLQMLSRGTPNLVLSHCSAYWDGTGIKPLTEEHRKVIQNHIDRFAASDANLLMLSYKSIHPTFAPVLTAHNVSEDNSSVWEDRETVSLALPPIIFPDVRERKSDSKKNKKSKKSKKSKKGKKKIEPSSDEDGDDFESESLQADTESELADGEARERRRKKRRKLSIETLKGDQIFIGMVAMRKQVKPYANQFVELLTEAGIRFVYMSADPPRASKALANKLGIDTNWNSCITLADHIPLEEQEPNIAKLPEGISSIRQHIAMVDPVPLLVPVFASADHSSKREMIKILQENGEVVCAVGSSQDPSNHRIFEVADVSLAWHCNKSHSCALQETEATEPEQIVHVDDLTTLPCSAVFNKHVRFTTVMEIFRTARYSSANMMMMKNYVAQYCFSLHLICLLLQVIGVTAPTYFGIQLIVLVFIVLPLYALPLSRTKPAEGLMEIVATKYGERTLINRRVRLSILQSIPVVVGVVALELWLIYHYFDVVTGNSSVPVIFSKASSKELDSMFSVGIFSSHVAFTAFVLYQFFVLIEFLHPLESVFKFTLKNNLKIIPFAITALLLQLLYVAVEMLLNRSWQVADSFFQFSWPHLAGLLWCIVVLAVIELVKVRDKKWNKNFNADLFLKFTTKLGQHSPV